MVTRIIDGDTIEIEGGTRVRYIGIDAPETYPRTECYGADATAKNTEWVSGHAIILEEDVLDKDSFGRLLRYVYVDDVFVNAELVRLGYAKASPRAPNNRYDERIARFEQEAKQARRGLWGACPTPTPTPPTARVTVSPGCSQFDAPGNDHENRNEEYVCLTNPSDKAVDMTNWRVQDEAGHTFIFPSFVLSARGHVLLHTGCGQNSTADLYWCNPRAVWDNDHDTVYLFDNQGGEVSRYEY